MSAGGAAAASFSGRSIASRKLKKTVWEVYSKNRRLVFWGILKEAIGTVY